MNLQIIKKIAIASTCSLFVGMAFAEQTVPEKAKDVANDAARSVKKGANRVKEAVCVEGDVECAAKKAKNRVKEGAEAAKDKVEEVKNKVD